VTTQLQQQQQQYNNNNNNNNNNNGKAIPLQAWTGPVVPGG